MPIKWLKDDLLVILNTFYTTWPYFLISVFDQTLDLCYIRGRFSIQGLQKTNPFKNIFNSWGICICIHTYVLYKTVAM